MACMIAVDIIERKAVGRCGKVDAYKAGVRHRYRRHVNPETGRDA